MKLELVPVRRDVAFAFIREHHRHHLPPQGWLFGIGLEAGGELVALVTIGRPVARHLDDGRTAEVTRCCTDGTPHAASKLYAAAWRACRAMGYRRLITYTLASECGTSLVAAGYRAVHETKAEGWSRRARARADEHPLEAKTRWEAA